MYKGKIKIIVLTSLRFRFYSSLWTFTLDFRAFRMSLSLVFIWDFISADSYGEYFPRSVVVITRANLLNTVDNMSLKIFHVRLIHDNYKLNSSQPRTDAH